MDRLSTEKDRSSTESPSVSPIPTRRFADAVRWVEVEGKIEKRDGVTLLKAARVELVPPPKPDEPE